MGLLSPDVELHDVDEDGTLTPYKPSLTATQQYLWEKHAEDVASVKALADGCPIILAHNGDMGHGAKYPHQLVFQAQADQVAICVANLEPWYRLPNLKTVRLLWGTSAHNFGEASLERIVSAQLRLAYPDVDTKTVRHSLLKPDGVRVDLAHHGPHPGSRTWLKGNSARYYLRDQMQKEINRRREPPRVYVRAHYHELIMETVRIRHDVGFYESDLVVVPSYCGLGDFAQQVTRSEYLITCGLIAIEIIGGKLHKIHAFWREQDLRTEEAL